MGRGPSQGPQGSARPLSKENKDLQDLPLSWVHLGPDLGVQRCGGASPNSQPSLLTSVMAEVTATSPLRALEAPSPLHLLPQRPWWLPTLRAEPPVMEDRTVETLPVCSGRTP